MAFVDDPTNSAGAGAARLITYNGPQQNGNPFSGKQDIDATLIGSEWISTNLTYSFPTNANQYQAGYASTPAGNDFATNPSGFIAFNAAQQTAARYALAQIQADTNVTFTEITETTTTHATIRFAQTSDPTLISAHAWFPANLNQSGDVWFGTAVPQPFYLTPAPGNWGQATQMHELGHAMGLKHGHQDYTNVDLRFFLDPSGANPRWGSQALPAYHNGQSWSLMTYASDPGDPNATNFQGDGFNQPQTYMQDDIAALQFLYGANFNTNNTSTTYTFSPTTGQMFINGVAQTPPTGNIIYRTIWDGGGIDTYDLSNYSTNLNIDLNPGAFSNFGIQVANNRPLVNGPVFAPGNIANALLYNGDVRSLIENAIGGTGNDTFTGNRVNNVIDGGGGTNTFVETGIHTNYSFRQLSTGYVQIIDRRPGSPDGVDQVTNIQNVQFADGTFAISNLLASTISFGSPAFQLNAFGPDGGWGSQDTNTRALADINHDGNADIVGFAASGIYVSLADGNGGFQALDANGRPFWGAQTGGWSSDNAYPRELADINHDNNADIVGFAQSGVFVSLADGTGGFQDPAFANGSSFWGAQTGGWSSQDAYTRELADINLDSNADIVGFAQSGVFVSLADGTGGFQAPAFVNGTSFWGAQTGGWSSQDKFPRFMADVDGNGYADIVGFAQAGVYVSLNTQLGASAPALVAGSSFWGTQTGGWSSQDAFPRELADVNGDGMADIVGFAQGGVYVSLATGNGSFAAPTLGSNTSFWGAQTGGWSSNDLFPRELANITTGDARADIVGFASNGVWTSISTSTGTPFTASVSSAVTNSSPHAALLSQYMAGSFAPSSAGDGDTLITDAAPTTQPDWLTPPHPSS
jgi:Peptidase M10 serralysin C terminal